jgi:hypothetical protein
MLKGNYKSGSLMMRGMKEMKCSLEKEDFLEMSRKVADDVVQKLGSKNNVSMRVEV